MRQHLYTQSTKMFEEDKKNLHIIMARHNIDEKNGSSKAIRRALQDSASLGDIHIALAHQTKQIESLTEQVQQLYFIMQGGAR